LIIIDGKTRNTHQRAKSTLAHNYDSERPNTLPAIRSTVHQIPFREQRSSDLGIYDKTPYGFKPLKKEAVSSEKKVNYNTLSRMPDKMGIQLESIRTLIPTMKSEKMRILKYKNKLDKLEFEKH
jgi:hypothetical protein